MHLVLTDILSCPHCGPDYGLIILADRMVDRRILEGRLGCANCERSYPVLSGVADLRTDGGWAAAAVGQASAPAVDLAALVGVTSGPGFALLAGGSVELAGQLADIVPGLEWITVADAFAGEPEQSGVNRIQVSAALPLCSGVLRGAIVADRAIALREVVRVLRPAARLVVMFVDDATVDELNALGMRVIARDAAMLVAARSA